jgi:Ran GTPase-activating protein (RanGAP) involved in mRNA processing and transport
MDALFRSFRVPTLSGPGLSFLARPGSSSPHQQRRPFAPPPVLGASDCFPKGLPDALVIILADNVPAYLKLGEAILLEEVLGVVKDVECLRYCSAGLRDRHVISITRLFRRGAYPRLKRLELAGNHLGEAGLRALALSLPSCPIHLEALEIGAACLTPQAGAAMAMAARHGAFQSLVSLSLEGSDLPLDGLEALMVALSTGGAPELEGLDLSRRDWAEQQMAKRIEASPNRILAEREAFATKMLSVEAAVLISSALGGLPKLRRLSLGGRWLGPQGVVPICQALLGGCCPLLEELDLCRNRLMDPGAVEVFGLVLRLRCLRKLSLGLNAISVLAARSFAQSLLGTQQAQELQVLDLRSNDLGPAGGSALAAVLVRLPKLEVLDLHENHLGSDGLEAIALAMAAGHALSLRQLFLSRAFSTDHRIWNLCIALRRGGAPRLRVLHLGHNIVSGQALAASFVENNLLELEELDISHASLGEAITLFFHVLKEKRVPRLQRLRMNGNSMGHGATVSLAEALREGGCRGLLELKAAENGVTPDACIYLSQVITEGAVPLLRTVDLRDNQLNDVASACLAKSLKLQCANIELLDLRGNGQITKKAMRGISRYLNARMPDPSAPKFETGTYSPAA